MSSVLIHYYRDHSGLLPFLKNNINGKKKKKKTENKTDLMSHLPDSPERHLEIYFAACWSFAFPSSRYQP